jgi:hypothetical protein
MVEEEIAEGIKQDIIDVLLHVKDSLEREDAEDLSQWSNHMIHCAALYRDQHAIYVGIIAYSLSKSISKKNAAKDDWDNFVSNLIKEVKQAIDAMENDEHKKFDSLLKSIMKRISDFDKSFSDYVGYVLDFAKVQKGARIYDHGLSLSSVAEMLGINKWELMEKVGETKSKGFEFLVTKKPKERLDELKKIMGLPVNKSPKKSKRKR